MLTFAGKYVYHVTMKKIEAIAMFGSPKDLAAALGVTRQAIYQWPEDLSQEASDRVIGAAARLGKAMPRVAASEMPPTEAAA